MLDLEAHLRGCSVRQLIVAMRIMRVDKDTVGFDYSKVRKDDLATRAIELARSLDAGKRDKATKMLAKAFEWKSADLAGKASATGGMGSGKDTGRSDKPSNPDAGDSTNYGEGGERHGPAQGGSSNRPEDDEKIKGAIEEAVSKAMEKRTDELMDRLSKTVFKKIEVESDSEDGDGSKGSDGEEGEEQPSESEGEGEGGPSAEQEESKSKKKKRTIEAGPPRHKVFQEVCQAVNKGLNVLLVGPAGCVDGEALVSINRGGKGYSIPLKRLVSQFNGEPLRRAMPRGGFCDEHWDLSIPTMARCYYNGEFRLRRITAAYPKGVKSVRKLVLANGKEVRLTDDHEVMMADGHWVRADALANGDLVMANGIPAPTTDTGGHYRWLEKGYWQISAGLKKHPTFGGKTDPDGYKIPEHRLVAEANLNGYSLAEWLEIIRDGDFPESAKFISSKMHVHHKDGDPTNNDISNLEILSRSEHSKEHDFQKHFSVMLGKPSAVVSCEPDGETEVFDITVDEAHNFTANGIVVHNCGKTHMAEEVAQVLSLPFKFTGAVSSEYKLLGFMTAQGTLVRTEYREAYENGGLFLWDELDASSAQALLSFNAGLSNGHQDFPDKVVTQHKQFRAVASANTYGNGADRMYIGRNQLDAASLDRFYVVNMDYDEDLECALYGRDEWVMYVQKARKAMRELGGIRHVISMRAIQMGLKMKGTGISRSQVEQACLWRHLQKDDVEKIKRAMK